MTPDDRIPSSPSDRPEGLSPRVSFFLRPFLSLTLCWSKSPPLPIPGASSFFFLFLSVGRLQNKYILFLFRYLLTLVVKEKFV